MKITVLRLGHRVVRDHRITTHVALVARAFGADEVIFSGERDEESMNSVKKIVEKWGGDFRVSYDSEWMKLIKARKTEGWKVVHFTMYGLPYEKQIDRIRKENCNLLLVVGGEKVPPEMYQTADYNISVTTQPHSEVAAVAVFLHDFFGGKELQKDFKNASVRIEPSERGKKFRNK